MNQWKKSSFLVLVALFLIALPTMAQTLSEPSVTVDGQVVVDDTVRIAEVVSEGNGFIVIHSVNEEGIFGDVIGHAPIGPGTHYNVVVDIDPTMATDTLFAVLHTDDGTVGEYEFGSVDGADDPVLVNEQLIAPTFNIELISASDQFVDDRVVIDSVTVSTDGFVVVHADNGEGAPGEVIGVAPVIVGTSTNVVVELDGEPTGILYPMLHADTNTVGEYEFGTVAGADEPVSIDGAVATHPIWTVPHLRVSDQAIISENMPNPLDNMIHIDSVLSDGPGFVVIHADANGQPGEVIGHVSVNEGLTTDVDVQIDGVLTPVVYPMLHSDTGDIGEYEFGTIDGVDVPVSVNGEVVTFPIDAAPSIVYSGTLIDNVLTIEKAVTDEDGWLVIHANNGDGGPGEVLGVQRIRAGVNYDVAVELDADMMTETVFPMLHYDTNEIGTYEFGTVDGADSPVTVNDAIVTGELAPNIIE